MDVNQPSWTAAGKVVFRFLVAYFLLYALPFPFSYIPGADSFTGYYYNMWYAFVPWVGRQFLGYDITIFPNGSGDTTFNYLQLLIMAVVSLAACIIWSLADRHRKNYDQASYWAVIGVRYFLGLAIMGYGFSKIFMMQFELLEPRLTQTYGESSPMGLLWTFMGYSYAYNLFTGLGELIGGVLLLFRRTATAGSLLLIAILSNVVILNFTYDVPVKLYSCHLLAMAIAVALLDGKRILNFLLNRPALPRVDNTYFTEGRIGKFRFAGNFLLVAILLTTEAMTLFEYKKQFAMTLKPALLGKYAVKEFSYNGIKVFQPSDTVAWKSLRIDYEGRARVVSIGDHTIHFSTQVDTTGNTFRLQTPNDRYDLHYRKTGNEVLELWGARMDFRQHEKNDTVRIKLEKVSKEHLLLSRGFRWINEYPDNR